MEIANGKAEGIDKMNGKGRDISNCLCSNKAGGLKALFAASAAGQQGISK